MAPTKHSSFSASASARLMACPASYQLAIEQDTGQRKSSQFAAEGTLAHAISEASLVAARDTQDFLGQTRSADGFEFTIDQDFIDATETYVSFIRGLKALNYQVALETVVSPEWCWPQPIPGVNLFGTSDCIAFNRQTGELVIADLKFGRGVAVEVVGNTQLRYYAAGSMDPAVLSRLFGAKLSDVRSVKLVIIQPRAAHPLGPIRSEDMTPESLSDWAENTLLPAVQTALTDNKKTFVPGKHCRFCPGLQNGVCNALQDQMLQTAKDAFANAPLQQAAAADALQTEQQVDLLSDQTLARLLDQIEVVKPLFGVVERIAQARMEQGQTLDGWKLVPRVARRSWADSDNDTLVKLDQLANAETLHPDTYSARVPLSPAQVQRNLKNLRGLYDKVIAPHVVKNSSGNNVAPEGDPRARVVALPSAQQAFAANPISAGPDQW